jgi:GT2 family glycosyltransferase
MESAKMLTINIVTWNSARFLPDLFASLDQQTDRAFTVTVVDNASTDGTLRWLQEHRPDVTVLRNFRNQGFARGHNQAIELALSRWDAAAWSHRYVLVANPDLLFRADAIERLLDYAESHPEVSSMVPKLLRATTVAGADMEYPETEKTNTIDAIGMRMFKSRRVVDYGAGEEDRGQYDGVRELFGPSGACGLFRASALQDVKFNGEYYDEDFFAYQEDVDLAWRMRRLGHVCHFVPGAVAWHHRRAPSVPGAGWIASWRLRLKKSPIVNYCSTRNHGWVMLKNDEWWNACLHAPWWFPYEFAKMLVGFFSVSQLRGEFHAVFGVPRMWRKRRLIASRARVSGSAMRRWFV